MNLNYGFFISIEKNKYIRSFDFNCEYLNSYWNIYICVKGYLNPDLGAINFDNIGNSLITVFIIVTLEGWTKIFTYASKSFKDKIYLNPLIIFLFSFIYLYWCFLFNLFR